jgi:hypothetical protein
VVREHAGVSRGTDGEQSAGASYGLAYSRDCSVELPLRPSARAAAPSGPRLFRRRLRAREWRLWC